MRGAPVHEPEVTPENCGWMIAPWPSTQRRSPREAPLDHKPLGGAREEVRDDGVDRDPPARDRDPGLPGRDEDRADAALPGSSVELKRHRHLPDRAVGADGQNDGGVVLEVRPARDGQAVGRPAQVSELDAVRARSARSGSSARRIASRFDVEPRLDRVPEESPPDRRQVASWVATPTSAVSGWYARGPRRRCRRSGSRRPPRRRAPSRGATISSRR